MMNRCAPISWTLNFELPLARLRQRIGTSHRSAADDRLQREFDRQVEIVGEDRLDALDRLAPVGLEGVRRVIVAMAEEEPDPGVDDPVEDELAGRIVLNGSTGDESRSERTVVSVFEQIPVCD